MVVGVQRDFGIPVCLSVSGNRNIKAVFRVQLAVFIASQTVCSDIWVSLQHVLCVFIFEIGKCCSFELPCTGEGHSVILRDLACSFVRLFKFEQSI